MTVTVTTTIIMPAVGSFVLIPFGSRATQRAHVVGYSRDLTQLKVRAWNQTQGKWMPGFRKVSLTSCSPCSGASLPPPPAIGGGV